MEGNGCGVKSRGRCNSARILVFDDLDPEGSQSNSKYVAPKKPSAVKPKPGQPGI